MVSNCELLMLPEFRKFQTLVFLENSLGFVHLSRSPPKRMDPDTPAELCDMLIKIESDLKNI